jgi:hypothetical protein
MFKKQKKGIQLNQAFGAVLTLVLVALLVIVAIYMVSSLQTNFRTANTAGSAVNESVTPTATGTISATLSAGSLVDGSCGAITTVYNGTSGYVIDLANFTQTGCGVVNASSMANFNTTLKFNYPYTYSADTSASNASGTIITQFATYPALVGLVGTIIFLALVIGVLVASFAFGGRRGA